MPRAVSPREPKERTADLNSLRCMQQYRRIASVNAERTITRLSGRSGTLRGAYNGNWDVLANAQKRFRRAQLYLVVPDCDVGLRAKSAKMGAMRKVKSRLACCRGCRAHGQRFVLNAFTCVLPCGLAGCSAAIVPNGRSARYR
jgi:hypothetical protein